MYFSCVENLHGSSYGSAWHRMRVALDSLCMPPQCTVDCSVYMAERFTFSTTPSRKFSQHVQRTTPVEECAAWLSSNCAEALSQLCCRNGAPALSWTRTPCVLVLPSCQLPQGSSLNLACLAHSNGGNVVVPLLPWSTTQPSLLDNSVPSH